MEFRLAKIEEIDEVLKLHSKYQINTRKEEDKKDGFVTTAFTKEQMKNLILEEEGLFIAIQNDKIEVQNIDITTFLIYKMYIALMIDWNEDYKKLDEKEIADNILHFLVNGLKRKEVEKDAE